MQVLPGWDATERGVLRRPFPVPRADYVPVVWAAFGTVVDFGPAPMNVWVEMRRFLLLLLLLAGCGPSETSGGDDAGDVPRFERDVGLDQRDQGTPEVPDDGTPDAGPIETDDGTDVGPGPDPDVGTTDAGGPLPEGPPFAVPATSGSYGLEFGVAISGAGSSPPVGAVAVTGSSGTVELDGRSLPVAVYEEQEWAEFGYTLYQGLAVDQDEWWVVWFYCKEGSLTDVYYQSTGGVQIDVVRASGSCAVDRTPTQVAVDFPESSLGIDLLDAFTVTGPRVELRPGEAGILRAGKTFEVYPFGHVDCSTACGASGWHEIHAVLRDPMTSELCFAIFYLYFDQDYALVTYAFSIPSLTDPLEGSVRLDGVTWTRN